MSAGVISESMKLEADSTAVMASSLSHLLSNRAKSRRLVKRVVEVVSLAAGLAALAVSLYTGAVQTIGDQAVRLIVTLSGATLVASVGIDRVLSDPPERFADFAFYLGGYQSTLKDIYLDQDDPNAARRLREIVRMAENNINDVRSKWPDLYEAAERRALKMHNDLKKK